MTPRLSASRGRRLGEGATRPGSIRRGGMMGRPCRTAISTPTACAPKPGAGVSPWLGADAGRHQLPRAPRVNARVIARLRRQLIAKYGERCAICGVTERLEVHHLDGNAMHNTLANVELRCLPHNPRGADTTRLAAKYQREPAMRAELAERYRMGGYPKRRPSILGSSAARKNLASELVSGGWS